MTAVVYIAGKGRSGSTLLDRLLGQLEGVVSVGELWRLWHTRDPAMARCGCGLTLESCPVWSQVLAATQARGVDAGEVAADQQRLFTWRAAPRLVVRPESIEDWDPARRYVAVMRDLYQDIAEVSGCPTVVDSSKWPFDPVVLSRAHDLDVHLVHLVRDLRGVTHSWQRIKYHTDGIEPQPMPRFGTLHSAASWTVRNVMTEWVARGRESIRIRYEDLVAAPDVELERIAELCGLSFRGLGIVAGSMKMKVTHTVAGNPGRMDHGQVAIRADDAWVREMPLRQRRTATVLGWPLLRRYGYV